MIITADWVLPVSSPPIRDGAVAVREGEIVDVGPTADLAAAWLDDPVETFEGCALVPGIVNAHTHLPLSILGGLLPPGPLHPWLRPVTKVVLGLTHEDFGVASAAGALESLRFGTTVVGDISYGVETPDACSELGLAGVFFWEVLGLDPHELQDSLTRRGYPEHSSLRIRRGLSPHAPYSSGPELLRYTRRLAREAGVPFAIHVAESADEITLMREGTGPFVTQAERLAHGFETPSASPVAYLDGLGVLDGAICVHAVHVDDNDIELLRERARGVVLCPRSNAYLENGSPPVAALRDAGVLVALGTDSSASNTDLDLFAEAAAVRSLDPRISATELLRMMTLSGAELLDVDRHFGALRAGAQADVVAVRLKPGDVRGLEEASDAVPPAEEVVRAVLAAGIDGGVEAVMTAGAWRVVDCVPTQDVSGLLGRARLVRERARELIGSD